MYTFEIVQLVDRFKKTKPTVNFRRWEPALYNELVQSTSFLPTKAPLYQRLWHVEHNTTNIPLCEVCQVSQVSWDHQKRVYRAHCSSVCSSKSLAVIAKREQTMNMRHGVAHYTNSPSFNEKRTQTYRKNHGTDWSLQAPAVREKIKNTVQKKYGAPVYTQTADYKKKNTKTLDSLNLLSSSQRRLSPIALACLSDEQWIREQHHTKERTISSIADELDVDTTTVISRLHQFNITLIRHSGSQGQRDMVDCIAQLGVNNICINDRSILPSGKEIDIYLPDYKLAIEYCGLYWHSADIHPRITKDYHQQKLTECTSVGIRLLTIFEDEWLHKKDIVMSTIQYIIGKQTTKLHARSCTVAEIPNEVSARFLDTYHIQGNGDGSICVGLYHEENLVAVCKIIRQQNTLVINRYASSCVIRGGFSKLLSYIKAHNNWESITTFADLRWSQGSLYGNLGFMIDKYLPPDYYYVKDNKRIHKFNMRHARLKSTLSTYDPTKTEVENCLAAGLFRVWDCGKIRYVIDNGQTKKSIPQTGA